MSKEDKLLSFSIITLGNSGVGKTSILRRFSLNTFDENILSTIGISFGNKEIILNNNQKIMLKLLDTAGQEKYKSLAKTYLKNADGVLFVFSLNEKESFDDMMNWIDLYNNNNGKSNVPRILVGNKSDLERKVEKDVIDKFLEKNKYLKYVDTSAKENTGINELFQELSEKLFQGYMKKIKKKQKNIKIDEIKAKKKGHCQCLGSDAEFIFTYFYFFLAIFLKMVYI